MEVTRREGTGTFFSAIYLSDNIITVLPLLIAFSAFLQIFSNALFIFSLPGLKVISISSDDIKELFSLERLLISPNLPVWYFEGVC